MEGEPGRIGRLYSRRTARQLACVKIHFKEFDALSAAFSPMCTRVCPYVCEHAPWPPGCFRASRCCGCVRQRKCGCRGEEIAARYCPLGNSKCHSIPSL